MFDLALLKRRTFSIRNLGEQLQRTSLEPCLTAIDLTFLGLGSIIGAGVYVLSGITAKEYAGPAVVFSYLVAAIAALLSALSYSEFAVDMPIAGGAFNYISMTFGEGLAWTVAWNMLLETGLSSAAVSRGFSAYLSTLLGHQPEAQQIDPLATLLIAILTLILCTGTKLGSRFNAVVCATNICVILFVLVAGFPETKGSNLTADFAPFGVQGVLSAASIVFFSYIGFDYIANCAEEAHNPEVSLPIAILASLGIATALYVLLSLTIVGMVPYAHIDVNAPFSSAFSHHPWAAKIVSFGALLGITTSTMTGLLSQARLFVVLGRERLLPGALSSLRMATCTTGLFSGLLALFLDIGTLSELVSIGTLYVFYAVCAAVIYRRYADDKTSKQRVLKGLGLLSMTAILSSMTFHFHAPWLIVTLSLCLWMAVACSFYFLPIVYVPLKFSVPFFPITPSLGILFTLYLIGSLGWLAYVRFVVWMAVGVAVYAFYGVHAAEKESIKNSLHKESVEMMSLRGAENAASQYSSQ